MNKIILRILIIGIMFLTGGTHVYAQFYNMPGTGTSRLWVEGKIGVGTTTPYAKLSVVGETVSAFFTATTSTKSTFPLASTTVLTAPSAYITALSNFTSNGFVKTGSGNGTLSIDTTTYQAAGNYITALTGDVTASGPGSVAATLATVNGNVGSFTNATLTVNGKGLITAASSGSAPVTAVTGTYPIVSSGGTTPNITLSGFSTTSVSCSGSTSCTPFTAIGGSPITISSSGGGGGSDVNWAFFNGSGLRPATSTNHVLIGTITSTSTNKFLEVNGGGFIDYASTTMVTAVTASTTNLIISGISGTQCLHSINGSVSGTGSDCGSGGGSGSYPFTPTTNYGSTNQATTGIAWFQNGLNASSTSHFDYATTTAISVSGLTSGNCVQASTGGLLTTISGACGTSTSQWVTNNNDIYYIGDSTTNIGVTATTPGSQRNDYSGELGFQFTLNSNILLTQLGGYVFSGNSQSHTIKIWDVTGTPTTLGSVSINYSGQTPSAFAYSTLSPSIMLTTGKTYAISVSETVSGDNWSDGNGTETMSSVVASYANWFTDGGSFFGGTPNEAFAAPNFKYILSSPASVGIGTTTPSANLAVMGISGTKDVFAVASSTNARIFTVAANGLTTSAGTARFTGPVDQTALGMDRLDIGVQAGTPRMIFEDAGSTIWQVDNASGEFRFFVPGYKQMGLTTSGSGVSRMSLTKDTTENIILDTGGYSFFTGGLVSYASTTIGNGTSQGGLTVFGSATTTGNLNLRGLTAVTGGNAICLNSTSFDVQNAGAGTCVTSAIRFKENVIDLSANKALGILMALRPVSFDYKEGYHDQNELPGSYGLIAEEVEKIDPLLVDYCSDGEVCTLHFEKFTGLFLKAIQEIYADVQGMIARISGLEEKLETQQIQIDSLQAQINELKK